MKALNPQSPKVWTSIAQILGAIAVNLLGQLSVHTPSGLYGARDEITTAGWILVILTLMLGGSALGILIHRRRARHLIIPTFFTLGIGAFVPVLAFSPILSGAVILWNLTLLIRYFFPIPSRRHPSTSSWVEQYGPAMRHLILAALSITAVTLGFQSSDSRWATLICLVLIIGALASTIPMYLRLARKRSRSPWFVALLGIVALVNPLQSGWVFGWFSAALLFSLIQLIRRSEAFEEFTYLFFGNPTLLIVGSFTLLIGAGTLLLSFPAASTQSGAIAPIDAFFTATSATCVTGLIVLDTATAYTHFGQGVLLLLIQLGGLNIMVLSAFAAQILGRSLGPRGELAIGEVLDHRPVDSSAKLVNFIIRATLAIEIVGAALLVPAFRSQGLSWAESLWRSIFHSVSAFCNAGFALQSDSLESLQGDPFALGVLSLLIISGGLGFGVLAFLIERVRHQRGSDYQTHARLVIATTVFLLGSGGFLWFALERTRSLAGLSLADQLMNSFFQSATLRTAGFNSIDFSLLHPSTLLLMLVFMFIGASPGGTGGGIKTTTAMMLLGAIPAMLRGRPRAVFFKRRIPVNAVYRAAAIVTIASLTISIGLGLLLMTEDLSFEVLLFETISAVATAGLSLGATPVLSPLGKIIVVVLMFIGRIGPLSLALILARQRSSDIQYPQARILVG